MINIGFISYLIGAVFYVALAVFILYRWGNRPGSRQFLVTVVFNAVWAGLLAQFAGPDRVQDFLWVLIVELIRMVLWVVLVWRFLFGDDRRQWPRRAAYYVHGTWVAVLLMNAVVMVTGYMGRPLISGGHRKPPTRCNRFACWVWWPAPSTISIARGSCTGMSRPAIF